MRFLCRAHRELFEGLDMVLGEVGVVPSLANDGGDCCWKSRVLWWHSGKYGGRSIRELVVCEPAWCRHLFCSLVHLSYG